MPSRDEIIEFLANAEGKVGKREISRAFGVKGADRLALKTLLAELAEEGAITGGRKRIRQHQKLPPVAVVEILGLDRDGELYGEPADWDRAREGAPPRLLVLAPDPIKFPGTAPGVGDRVLAQIGQADDASSTYRHEARPIKRLERERRRLLGIFRKRDKGGGGTIMPIDRKQLREWAVSPGNEGEAAQGELVRFDISRLGSNNLPQAIIVERLGNPEDQRQFSLIAVHTYGIPDTFPRRVEEEVEKLPALDRKGRTDLTDLPLVTIDPADARDHDDAVWAAPDDDLKNPGGFAVIVTIADVATYVRPGTALDREALKRGNSVYFPDRVVPMLPERISNDLCSLREREVRPCLAVRMVFDNKGTKRAHHFSRALMRSAAKLTYQEAQAAIDGQPNDKTGPLLEPVLKPLWAAYELLAKARDARGPLELDLPERKILLGSDGKVARIVVPERLVAHRLIEEFMIQANVAAAETLEARRSPLIYRVHEAPSKEKLEGLKQFLETLGLGIAQSGPMRPDQFNRVLAQTRGGDIADLVSEVVLRSQAQAVYAHENLGHFGLNLQRYAHFTSPIRRYADLVVHRALVRALQLGGDGLSDAEIPELARIAQSISEAERRAMAAERETADRLIATFLADRIGAEFRGRIAGITRSGLFVKLNDTGADGFVAISTIGPEYFHFDEVHYALVGERSGQTYRLGDRVEVKLVEAIPTAGALRFEMLTPGKTGVLPARRLRLGKRGKPGPRRRR